MLRVRVLSITIGLAALLLFNPISAQGRSDPTRSLQDLLTTLNGLKAKGMNLYLRKQGLDTSTPAGKAMFQMLGVFAEFEREMIAERIHAGLARAKEQGTPSGKPIGRPERFTKVRSRVLALQEQGLGSRRISQELGVARSTVSGDLRPWAAACSPDRAGLSSVRFEPLIGFSPV
jgi:DNA invertase Pin-like site-specific DNA recombinase